MMRRTLHFIGIAGVGWLLDSAVFYALVSMFHWSPFVSNFVGGICGATFTFLFARERIFHERRGATWVRLSGYLSYTLVLLIVASAAVQWLAVVLDASFPSLTAKWAAVVAKVVVTPGTLALNYVVAKFLNTK